MKRSTRLTRWVIRIAVVAAAFTAGVLVSPPFAHPVAGRAVPASLPVAAPAPPTSRGAQAVWVLPPPEAFEAGARTVQALRAGYLATTQTHPGVRYVDAQAVLGGPHGEYLRSVPGPRWRRRAAAYVGHCACRRRGQAPPGRRDLR